MTEIKFYNGLKQIGGTFICVETDVARCMFDFGFAMPDFYDRAVSMRSEQYISDYIKMNLLPCADEIYDVKTAKECGLIPADQAKKKNFFFISHMHIDHMGGLGMLDESIPVYMSQDSKKMYHVLEKNKDYEFGIHKNVIGVDYGEKIKVGDIALTVLAVDHDVLGASGCLIETADGTVAYTGDYRFHGYHPDVTAAFANKLKNVDVLITEGVTLSFEDIDILREEKPQEEKSEYTLRKEMEEILRHEKKAVVINPYNRNVERIYHMAKLAVQMNRTFVMDVSQANLLNAFYPKEEIHVYKTPDFVNQVDTEYKMITLKEIRENPGKYMIQLDYKNLYTLLDLNNCISVFCHMDGAPLGSYDASFEKLSLFLKKFQIPYQYLSLGGHAKPYYIRELIDTINPKVLVPIHSMRPQQVHGRKVKKRILPEYGDVLQLPLE